MRPSPHRLPHTTPKPMCDKLSFWMTSNDKFSKQISFAYKIDQQNFIDRGRKPWLSSFSLLLFPSVKKKNWAPLALIPLLPQLKFKLDVWPMSCHVSTIVRVRFWPKVIYCILVQVQIISHELNSSRFLTS